jgi:hypothetical protein
MKNDDIRHEAVMALCEMWSSVPAVEIELTAVRISPRKIINAIDICIDELKETRKAFEGFVATKAGSIPAAPVKVRP